MKALLLISVLFALPSSALPSSALPSSALPGSTYFSGGPRTYLLKNKTVIKAEILEVNAGEVKLRFVTDGGSGIVTRKLDDFTPASQFNILRSVTDKEDFEGHIKLAEFAVQNGLIVAGRKELFKARKIANDHGIAPELEDKLIDEAVKAIDGLLRAMVAQGKTKDAKNLLREIMHAPRLSDEQKEELVNLVHSAAKAPSGNQAEQAASASRTQTSESTQLSESESRRLKPLQDRLARGKEHEKKALMNSRSQSTSINQYNRAIKEFETVDKNISSMMKQPSSSSAMVAELQSLGQEAEGDMISSLLGQASIYMTRSSFNDALGNIGKVLAIDSQNQQALDMQARIEIAANDDDDYWRGGVRRIRRGEARPRTQPVRRGGGRR